MKQNGILRLVAAAMAEADDADAQVHARVLASSPTRPVVAIAVKLCISARADERRVGLMLADELLAAQGLENADQLSAAAETARRR